MFNDIIDGNIINENTLNGIYKNFMNNENIFIQEMNTASLNCKVMAEASILEKTKTIIRNAIEAFKQFITAIVKWLKGLIDTVLKKYKSKVDEKAAETLYQNITIGAPENIKHVFRIYLSVIAPAAQNLINLNVEQYLLKLKMSNEDIKESINRDFSGYVPVLKKYNGKTADEIFKILFGETIIQRGVDPKELTLATEKLESIRMLFNKFIKVYEYSLYEIDRILEPSDFAYALAHITDYFALNVNIISGLMAQTINMCNKALMQINKKINLDKEGAKNV